MTSPPSTSSPAGSSFAAAPVSFSQAIRLGLLDWRFARRASRSEFWFLVLAYVPVYFALSFLGRWRWVGYLGWTISVVAVVILFKVAVRRYHDIGRSGWWTLLGFLVSISAAILAAAGLVVALNNALGTGPGQPSSLGDYMFAAGLLLGFMNATWMVVWLCLPGESEANNWG